MSRQLDFYKKNKAAINRQRRLVYAERKAKMSSESKAKKRKAKPSTSHIGSPSLFALHESSPSFRIRLHRFQRTYAIQNAVSEDKLRALKLNDRLNHVIQYLGAGFRLIKGASWTLELEGLEIISDYHIPAAIRMAQAVTLGDNIARQLADQYSFRIAQEGHTPPKLTEHELDAIQMTERLKSIEKRGILPLYTDSEGYKIWADWSDGVGGMESNKVAYMQKLSDFAKDLAEKDGWEQMKANMVEVTGLLVYYAKNMESHAKLVKQAGKLIKELRKERRKAATNQPANQRKLI